MSFPHQDSHWQSTYSFLKNQIKDGDFIVSPTVFWEVFPRIFTYQATLKNKNLAAQWVVIHKGDLQSIGYDFLAYTISHYQPVFANEVFVVFSNYPHIPIDQSMHLQALLFQFKDPSTVFGKHFEHSSMRLTGIPSHKEKIVNFSFLSQDEVRQEMNQLFLDGGYEFPRLYDQKREEYMFNLIKNKVAFSEGKTILSIGCGNGSDAHLPEVFAKFIGIDLSDVAIEQAQKKYKNHKEYQFLVMNAMDLAFDDSTFDIVLGIEVIEHVPDYKQLIAEAVRVLKPGGMLLLTVANKDSFHLRIVEQLLGNKFKTNYQHFEEFSVDQINETFENVGLEVKEIIGGFFLPYWGVPGISQELSDLAHNNLEVINLLKDIGQQVNPRYCYDFISIGYKIM